MKPTDIRALIQHCLLTLAFCAGPVTMSRAQEAPSFSLFQVQTNREMLLRLEGPKGVNYRIDAATDISAWTPLISLTNATGTVEHTDTAAPFPGAHPKGPQRRPPL